MSSTRCAFLIMWLILAGLLTLSPDRGCAFEGGGRTFELRRDLRTVRPRVEREPRASAYALSDVERRLHDRRIDAPRDPRLTELEIEARRLRWQADRNARRSVGGRPATGLGARHRAPIQKPRDLGLAHASVGAPPAATDFGGRVIALQRQIGRIEALLEQGQAAAAVQSLVAGAAELEVLRGAASGAVANDPNLIALAARLDALQQRLE